MLNALKLPELKSLAKLLLDTSSTKEIKKRYNFDFRKRDSWLSVLSLHAKETKVSNIDKDKKIFLLFSGGKGSLLAAFLLKILGYTNVTLYFNDTKSEDRDLYRFIKECRMFLGYEYVEDNDGRDIWQVFKDNRFMANSRVDLCSKVLKRNRSDKFRKQYNPNDVVFMTGIDIWEEHRHQKAQPHWEPYTLSAPLVEQKIYDKEALFIIFQKITNIKQPRLYDLGFLHNNCGGFCVKAGLAHYKQLLERDRERYLDFEKKELEVYKEIGQERPFLKKQIKGIIYYLTLRDYRILLEEKDYAADNDDQFDFGGCGACALNAS